MAIKDLISRQITDDQENVQLRKYYVNNFLFFISLKRDEIPLVIYLIVAYDIFFSTPDLSEEEITSAEALVDNETN